MTGDLGYYRTKNECYCSMGTFWLYMSVSLDISVFKSNKLYHDF